MATERARTPIAYYVLATALIVLAVAAVGFVIAMILRPGVVPPEATVVTGRDPIECTSGTKDATCYDTEVTNSGGSAGIISCRLDAAGDTEATFENGAPTMRIALGPSENVHIVSAVTAPGVSPAAAPRVLCTASSD